MVMGSNPGFLLKSFLLYLWWCYAPHLWFVAPLEAGFVILGPGLGVCASGFGGVTGLSNPLAFNQ